MGKKGIEISYVISLNQSINIFTKPLDCTLFENLKSELGMVNTIQSSQSLQIIIQSRSTHLNQEDIHPFEHRWGEQCQWRLAHLVAIQVLSQKVLETTQFKIQSSYQSRFRNAIVLYIYQISKGIMTYKHKCHPFQIGANKMVQTPIHMPKMAQHYRIVWRTPPRLNVMNEQIIWKGRQQQLI